MARLLKIKEFHQSTFNGWKSNRHVWMELRDSEPYPALICGWRDGLCKEGYLGIVGQVRVAGGREEWFQVANYAYNRRGYNVKWRLWTKCPSEEQRKNTPWDVNTIS